MKHFAVVDITDGNNEVIGVIQNIPLTLVGLELLNERLIIALIDHLDTDDFNIEIISLQDIKEYKPIELSIEVDGLNYFVELQEVFFY